MALIYPLWNGKCQCINLCSEWHQICHFFHWSQHTKYDSNLKQKFWLLSKKSKNYPPPPKKNANQKILQIFDFYGRVVYIELRWNDIFRETAFSISLSLLLTHKPAVTGWRSQRAHRTFCCLIIEGKFNFEPVRNPGNGPTSDNPDFIISNFRNRLVDAFKKVLWGKSFPVKYSRWRLPLDAFIPDYRERGRIKVLGESLIKYLLS